MTATVQITHYGHACVLAELPDGTRILFDPGTYSAGFEDLTGLDGCSPPAGPTSASPTTWWCRSTRSKST
jgi:L-ascorbate metabolism protein UlaG (beta-lactamase superfamily)